MSVMLSAAGSLRWFRDALAPGVAFGDLVAPAGRGPGRQRRPAVPALPDRRAQPAPGSAGPRRVRRADRRARPAAPDPRRPRGRRLRPARRARPDDRGRDAGARPDPGLGRRDREPALAPDPGRRARGRDRHGQHDRGRGLRRRPAGRRRRRLVPDASRRPPTRWSRATPVAAPGPDAPRYAEAHAIYRELYPALAPTFHRALSRRGAGRPRQPSSSASSVWVTSPGFLPMMIIAEDLVGGHVVLVDRADDPAVVHHADPVGQVEHVVDVVADQEDPDALGLELRG